MKIQTVIATVFLLFQCVCLISGHTWIECVNVTNPYTVTHLGDMRCNGYARNWQGRVPNPDNNLWKIQGISPAQYYNYPACKTQTRSYPGQYPMMPPIKAGDSFWIAYTPNGHTRWHRPAPPPNGPRMSYIKWTGVPGTSMSTMRDVESAPTMFQTLFDQPCHHPVTGAQLDSSSGICRAQVKVPNNTPSGTYQLVWWWPFNFSNADIEHYTSCWDIQVVGAASGSTSSSSSTSTSTSTSTSGGSGSECCNCCNCPARQEADGSVDDVTPGAVSDNVEKTSKTNSSTIQYLYIVAVAGICAAVALLTAGVAMLVVIWRKTKEMTSRNVEMTNR